MVESWQLLLVSDWPPSPSVKVAYHVYQLHTCKGDLPAHLVVSTTRRRPLEVTTLVEPDKGALSAKDVPRIAHRYFYKRTCFFAGEYRTVYVDEYRIFCIIHQIGVFMLGVVPD